MITSPACNSSWVPGYRVLQNPCGCSSRRYTLLPGPSALVPSPSDHSILRKFTYSQRYPASCATLKILDRRVSAHLARSFRWQGDLWSHDAVGASPMGSRWDDLYAEMPWHTSAPTRSFHD